MKIGILSESKVDEAAYKILVESILDRPIEIVKSYRKRGGWAQAKALVGTIIREEQARGRLSSQTRRDLKISKYGSLEASADIKLQRTLENARRLADDLDGLELRFQFGFGHLRNDLEQW